MQTENAAKLVAACEAVGIKDVVISTFNEGKEVPEHASLQVTRAELQALRDASNVLITHEWHNSHMPDSVLKRYGVYISVV